MEEQVRLLVVDDSEDDALLLADELRSAGYDISYMRVDTPEMMDSALRDCSWDLIIADYRMPRFSGPAALEALQASGQDIPLILVSGTADEHTGVDMMRAGAQDFIVKHSLSRLVPAVARELGEARSRKERIRAEDAARASAENYGRIFKYAPVAIVTYDRDAVVMEVNPAFEQLFGFTNDEVVGRHIWETFGRPQNAGRTREETSRIFDGEVVRNVEYENVCREGSPLYVLVNITPVCNEQDEVIMALAMMTDITEGKRALEREREQETHRQEFYRRTILAATNGKLVVSELDGINELAGPVVGSWQISSLDDVSSVRDAIRELATSLGMERSKANDLMGCAVEAMANAHKHAGGGVVTLHRLAESLIVVVTDSGPGIEALALPAVALTKGYTTGTSLGMGYKVMIELSDRLYLSTSSEGTSVAIEMRLAAAPVATDEFLVKLSGW